MSRKGNVRVIDMGTATIPTPVSTVNARSFQAVGEPAPAKPARIPHKPPAEPSPQSVIVIASPVPIADLQTIVRTLQAIGTDYGDITVMGILRRQW
jgi:hypothetical protein